MQTFLPYSDFGESARCLDRQRLGKQRVECYQILVALTTNSDGWSNHPAVCMWRNYERALYRYSTAVCHEWMNRGYRDSCQGKIWRLCLDAGVFEQDLTYPPWLGDEAFHRSHQSNLKRKDPKHYGPLFPEVPDDLPYIWPNPSYVKPTSTLAEHVEFGVLV